MFISAARKTLTGKTKEKLPCRYLQVGPNDKDYQVLRKNSFFDSPKLQLFK